MPTKLPLGLWQEHSTLEQRSATVRPGEPPHHDLESDSTSIWRKHAGKTEASIQLTVTRKRREIPRYTDGTDPNTSCTAREELQHHHRSQTSDHTLDCQTCSILVEQICSAQRWTDELLQEMEQGTQDTTLRVWRDSAIHDPRRAPTRQAGTALLHRHLARQGHTDK